MFNRNQLDEMQEQKLLHIERNGCWFAFWGLLLALVVQALLGLDMKALAGEWVLFMALAVYLGIACARRLVEVEVTERDVVHDAVVGQFIVSVRGVPTDVGEFGDTSVALPCPDALIGAEFVGFEDAAVER